MRYRSLILPAIALVIAAPVVAELQSLELGGELRIRARGNLNYQNSSGDPARTLIPSALLLGRPLGAGGVASRFRFDDRGRDRHYVEMEARVNATARFTDDVLSFIEFETVDNWGTQFRSDFVTGLDFPGGSNVDVLQAYIEVSDMFGYPLRLRLGRQTMKMGKGWLVGDMISAVLAFSFDAVRLTYSQNDLTVDAWWSKLTENFAGDEDVDFYGVYGTYSGFESVKASLYWMLVRDGRSLEQTNLPALGEWVEGLLGYDNFGSTTLHTVGTRLWGGWGAFDFDWELAYQFGDADQQGFGFIPVLGGYGDDDASFDSFGTDLEMGYTFDAAWQPRVYLGGAWFEGEDNRDVSLWEFLNPFDKGEASVSFNRLFAHTSSKYSFILDSGQVLSNFQAVRVGVELQPAEKFQIAFELEQFWVDEPFDRPAVPVPFLSSVWTKASDDDLGLQTTISGRYDITEDLWLKFRWEHLFSGDAISDGNFSDRNGLRFFQGSDDDDADYMEATLGLKF